MPFMNFYDKFPFFSGDLRFLSSGFLQFGYLSFGEILPVQLPYSNSGDSLYLCDLRYFPSFLDFSDFGLLEKKASGDEVFITISTDFLAVQLTHDRERKRCYGNEVSRNLWQEVVKYFRLLQS